MIDAPELVFETDLDAPLEKVWRALSIPEYVDRWLQPSSDTELSLVTIKANSSLTYRLSERQNESFVTFEIEENAEGGTFFRLTHVPAAANSNEPVSGPLMLAA